MTRAGAAPLVLADAEALRKYASPPANLRQKKGCAARSSWPQAPKAASTGMQAVAQDHKQIKEYVKEVKAGGEDVGARFGKLRAEEAAL